MKNLNKRFDEIFADFKQDSLFEPYDSVEIISGWLWECDDLGDYLTCSPEVEDVLGYSPQELIGQPLTEFALPTKSSRKISNVLKLGNLPAEISVDFIKKNGDLVPVSLFVYDSITTEGKNTGLRGFAQVILETERIQPVTPDEEIQQTGAIDENDSKLDDVGIISPIIESELVDKEDLVEITRGGMDSEKTISVETKAEQKQGVLKVQIASEIIVNCLEKLRANSPVIQNSPLSRVIVNDREEFRIDRTKEPWINESIAGKVVHAYPKVLVREIEHRLEWGDKFDFTDEESTFVSRFRLRSSGVQGILRNWISPKSILKCDYAWVLIIILDVQGKEQSISLNYSQEGKKSEIWGINDVIGEPELVFHAIEKAINNPQKVRETFYRGGNYLLK
ncbi:MAG: PAS domain-containing protein [Anaerolineales bacterium]|nr:PAS domain-containing protein [Anaerolineales bacterium]